MARLGVSVTKPRPLQIPDQPLCQKSLRRRRKNPCENNARLGPKWRHQIDLLVTRGQASAEVVGQDE